MSDADLIDLGYQHTGFDELLNWHTYSKNEDVEYYVEDGKIVSIACWAGAIYKGNDLIGKNTDELLKILGKPDRVDDPVWVSDDIRHRGWCGG